MKKELFLLFIILVSSFLIRLWRIDNPIADWHSWRQADTAAVTRNFVKDGIELLHPRFDDLSKIPSGLENPQGYRFVEFPLYNATTAIAFQAVDRFPIEVWGRLVSIVSSLGSLLFLYLLTKKYLGMQTALLAAFFFGFIPYNIYYSRAILPDPSMVMAILGGTYFFDRWISLDVILRPKAEESRTDVRGQAARSFATLRMTRSFFLAILFTASAFLLKPFALFFTLPMIYLAFRKWGVQCIAKPQLWLFALITLAPLIFWRLWMQQFPEGIPSSDWLFNADNIRFKGAFFHWIFADRIGRLILGYWGIALLVIGLVRRVTQKEGFLFYSFLASTLLYVTVIAGGNVRHDYYQILIVPTLAIFVAKGADFLLSAPKEHLSRVTCYLLLVTCTVFMLAFGWFHVRDYFNINNQAIVAAGKVVDTLTPRDAKIIAPYNGDSAFLYQTNRKGWPVFDRPIEEFVKAGADYMVIVNPTKSDYEGFGNMYKIVASSDQYILFDLKKPLR